MPRYRSARRLALGAGALATLATLAVPLHSTGANAVSTPTNVAKTVYLSLPGPFNGCTFLDAGATPSTNAILDLVRPSAFQTSNLGTLVGEGGAISSAELTSLTPETVRYTVAPHQKWSDGAAFTGADLVAWYQRAVSLPSVNSDGYRAIKSLVVSKNHLAVTAVFKTPYAAWNLLFRDVEARGAPASCSISSLVDRPSLGPYVVSSASRDVVVLTSNPRWPIQSGRFARVVVRDNNVIPKSSTTPYVNFTLEVGRAQVEAISSHATSLSHFGSSSNLEEVTFAPHRPWSSRLSIREALSWSISRQHMIDQLLGTVTFLPSVAASALFTQGQPSYPGTTGTGPTSQTTTTVLPATTPGVLEDCTQCAIEALTATGLRRSHTGWSTIGGARLAIDVAVGPSSTDRLVASSVVRQWRTLGVRVHVHQESSEEGAAIASARSQVDASIFTRPTVTAPSYAARSWSGPGYADSFPGGWRSSKVNVLYSRAIALFNPVTAATTWLAMDQTVLASYWVRPLFTEPSLMAWADTIGTVAPTYTIPGLVDQLPTWTTISPQTGS